MQPTQNCFVSLGVFISHAYIAQKLPYYFLDESLCEKFAKKLR